ncbi:MAG: hypothetical protein R3B83_04015 [Nitrospirales bacterium]|nr:hypothetical protein [Nitrospirales bacterium]
MEIELESQGPNSGYQGFLHILRELTQSSHRLDIQEVTMSGTTKSESSQNRLHGMDEDNRIPSSFFKNPIWVGV